MTADQTYAASPSPRRSPIRQVARVVGLLVAAGFVGLLLYGVISKAPDTSIDDSLDRAQPVPAPVFELAVLQRGRLGPTLGPRLQSALADGRVALDELRGTPVVLNFWASWCIPCREEAPLMQRTWRREARPRGVLFLGLDMQDFTDEAHGFLREFGVDYLNIRDSGNSVARSYGVTGLPETFFISKAGLIVNHVVGVVSSAQLRAGLEAAMAGRTVGAQQGGDQRPVR